MSKTNSLPEPNDQWNLWEVFIQESDNEPHRHAGSIRGADAENALQNARDVFARRGKTKSIWIVQSDHIVATTTGDSASFFDPTSDKVYRHPHFYKHTLDDELWKK
ncbi:MAG: 1,2-phenylacetyl-CoA epoxidase subunit B [Bacteroidetes bacterium]|nr:1,2-phenylacetyl-CoA epoxidase subunit B [Bacteroidota bacterium]